MKLVADHYPIEPTGATLVRTFNNDVYRIDASDQSYALKVYGSGRFTPDEVQWEQQLAHHLANADLPVAADVALTTGDSAGTFDAPEGQRLFALTHWVPGNKPQPPWDNTLYRTVGASLARLHTVADSFTSSHPRQPVRRGDEPEQVIAALAEHDDRRRLVQRTAAAAQNELARLASRGLHWGIRHGDPSLDNIHVSGSNLLYFYDLDLAGPGWQVEDLAGALSTEFADPFLDGYVSERPLSAVDLEALPWLRILGHIDGLKFHLVDKPAAMGSSTLTEGWVDRGFEGLLDAAQDAGIDGAGSIR